LAETNHGLTGIPAGFFFFAWTAFVLPPRVVSPHDIYVIKTAGKGWKSGNSAGQSGLSGWQSGHRASQSDDSGFMSGCSGLDAGSLDS